MFKTTFTSVFKSRTFSPATAGISNVWESIHPELPDDTQNDYDMHNDAGYYDY
jgi:hypothetical protein